MIKQLILLIQLLGVFFYQLIFSGDITVKQQVPNEIVSGSEAVVEIIIKKNDITGFAKVQQDFPDGFTAEPLDTKGATFSFKDNKIKFIWMALPSDEEFTISYKIKPNENTEGKFSIGGKFSFIADSERKNIEIEEASFTITKQLLTEESVTEQPTTEEPTTEEPVVEQPVTEEPTTEQPVSEEPATAVSINCKRTIESIEDGKYKVTVEINKNGIQGFAKITEQIPDGFTASEGDSKGGVFSFREKEAKILWMAIPKETTYTISYNIIANAGTVNGNYEIKGYYSYLENDITQKYDLESSSFELNVEMVAEEPTTEEPVTEEPTTEEPVVEQPTTEEPVTEEPTTNGSDNNSGKVTSVPNPEKGVSYKVQVGAGHQKVPSNYFAVKFNLKDNVSTENHEGWIKYIVGSYSEYKAARDKRNIVRNNVKTAFVTAYNSGNRITVQEALMISNQKWYK